VVLWPPFLIRREMVVSSDGIKVIQHLDRLCPLKDGGRGVPYQGEMRLGGMGAILLDTLGPAPFSAPFHFQPASDGRQGPGTLASHRTSLVDCLWFSVLQLGLARRTAVASSRPNPTGQ
jgi:hypothetical protein